MPRKGDITQQIVAADLCTGCGACAALAPKQIGFGLDESGFMRPRTHSRLSRGVRNSITKICPGQQQIPEAQGDKADLLWGSYRQVLEGWSNDKDIRFEAASGGALTGLLAWLLKEGKVDAVLSTAADPDNPVGNRSVISRSRDDLLRQAASRYAPSAPLLKVPRLLEGKTR
ncbi:MAG: coenzyme F420 hydrogenase/dehydrogenase beta subunit N-terminal domain-containing protein, partial [Pseudomonadota bacterium]